MASWRTSSSQPQPKWLLSSRVLAVLSCALALLAANPAMVSARLASTSEMVSTLDQANPLSVLRPETSPDDQTPRPRRVTKTSPTPAQIAPSRQDSHMLRALAQWSDLLTRHLASILAFTPQMALSERPQIIPAKPGDMTSRPAVEATPPQGHETLFALAHCLLAPPPRA